MALTEFKPSKDWVKIIHDNFEITDPKNLNWKRVSPGCTPLNGTTLGYNDMFVTTIGNAKLCLLELQGMKVPKFSTDTPCIRVPQEYKPAHVVSGSVSEAAYIAERTAGGSTDFICWSNGANGGSYVGCGGVEGGNASLVWISADQSVFK